MNMVYEKRSIKRSTSSTEAVKFMKGETGINTGKL